MKRWFTNSLKKIMEHNEYEPEMLTVEECSKANKWTPTDLILREYYNNGCSSAKGFLGLTPKRCFECYWYIQHNLEELISMNYISENGYNNFGFPLWNNYDRPTTNQ